MNISKLKSQIIWIFPLIVLAFFCFSVLRNISHPLLWNDEGDTVMFAERIIKFGYPKVHDGKNVVNLTEVPDKDIGVDKKTDAWLLLPWLQYYFTAPSAFINKGIDNLYLKTGIIRTPFALAGIFGIAIFAAAGSLLIENKKGKVAFFVAFGIFEILSLSLTLHFREARAHVLAIFILALLIYLFIRYFILDRLRFFTYFTLTFIFVTLLVNNFPPAYLAYIISIFSYVFIVDKKSFIKVTTPLVASFIPLIPFLLFFKPLYISGEVSKHFGFNTDLYIFNVTKIIRYFFQYEYLILFLIIKIILVFMLKRYSTLGWNFHKLINSKEKLGKLISTSSYFSLFIIIYILVVSRVPYVFERYFIVVQPILVISALLDLAAIFSLISPSNSQKETKKFSEILIYTLTIIFVLNSVNVVGQMKGHIYELTHVYQGPLDFVIPYIKANFKEPENLVIATNYEELLYMYYLGSKVTVGYTGNNLEEDLKNQPDIIIPRKSTSNNIDILNYLLEKGKYRKISFPIYDYQFNNIPEVSLPNGHLFKTKFANNDDERLDIFIKI